MLESGHADGKEGPSSIDRKSLGEAEHVQDFRGEIGIQLHFQL